MDNIYKTENVPTIEVRDIVDKYIKEGWAVFSIWTTPIRIYDYTIITFIKADDDNDEEDWED